MTDKRSGAPVVRALLGTGVAIAARGSLGLRPPRLWSGLRLGGAAAGVVAAGVAATTTVPKVRAAMTGRDLPDSAAGWLAVDIPLGTVWTEETLFRGALQALAVRALGPANGRLLQAAAFGLWHIPDARKTGEPILGTVLVTGLAGWVFGWLAERSGSLLAPVLAHLAINEAGAVAALVVQRPPNVSVLLRRVPRRHRRLDGRILESMPARRNADPEATLAAVRVVAPWLRDETAATPDRAAIAMAVRLTARTLAGLAPGASVEVRIPPFVAVQCISGPRHTRGTPPNVVETDPRTWLRLATGLLDVDEATKSGAMRLSGSRAGEVTTWLPVVSPGD